jgi:hypothetical protein
MPQPTEPFDVSFARCVLACWDDRAFMREYRRLTGHTLGQDCRSTIDRMIDDATAAPFDKQESINQAEARAFFRFVYEIVWAPLASVR